ncbi:MAG: hypothetical protein RLO81_16930 [Fulvivirga sp.]|uniref:hypothetical protein n=1 Tax=Fulvivirga sp. TaxID=1931237 RepID=UPI0032F04C07
MNEKLESQLVGVAGEYLVAGELSLRGILASITLRNSKGIDIIASNSDASKSISIQVKTNSNGANKWILNKKSEDYYSENLYYVFVAIRELGTRPNFHIVPSKIVASFIKEKHKTWLSGNKRDGSRRKDSNMRKFIDSSNQYLENWDILGI